MSEQIKTCRSCGAPILWRHTLTGRPMPIDPEPVEPIEGGTYLVLLDGSCRAYLPEIDAGKPVYRSHFASCPHAGLHRRTT